MMGAHPQLVIVQGVLLVDVQAALRVRVLHVEEAVRQVDDALADGAVDLLKKGATVLGWIG